MLSRKEMVDIIVNRKESVILNGNIIDNVNDLPSEAELAKGDSKREAAARESLEAQMKALKDQLAILDDEKAQAKEDAKAEKAEKVEKESDKADKK